MKQLLLLLILVVMPALIGCRVNPRAEREIALLRAEILDLEDQYYSLKSKCEAAGVTTDSSEVIYETYDGSTYCEDCEVFEPAYDDESIAPTFSNEPVGSGANDEQLEFIDPTENSSSLNNSMLPRLDGNSSSSVSFRGKRPTIANNIGAQRIKSIRINSEWSRGEDLDNQLGDEGLALLIQPLDEYGVVSQIPGYVTVRIVESSTNAVSRQIGMWRFTPEEIRSFFVNDEFIEQGILLHLPWNNLVPKSSKINVFVRLTTEDQRNLDASSQIIIEPPARDYSPEDPLVASWIENDERWIRVGVNSNFQSPKLKRSSRESTMPRRDGVEAPRWRPVR